MFLFPAKTFLSGQLIQEYSKIYHDCLCNAKTNSCMQYQKQVYTCTVYSCMQYQNQVYACTVGIAEFKVNSSAK